MSCNWFPTKYDYFHEFLLTQIWLFALNISVCTDTEHQGNRFPAARNSASPLETFAQKLNTPGTVTILQAVLDTEYIDILTDVYISDNRFIELSDCGQVLSGIDQLV